MTPWLPKPYGIIAVDPGAMCGGAVLHWATDVYPWELSPLDTGRRVNTMLQGSGDTIWHVVSERFVPQAGVRTPQLDAIEVNGMLRWIASQYNVTFELQSRSEAKKIMTDQLLRKLDVYTKTKDGHANDATRHAFLRLHNLFPVLYVDRIGLVQ